MLYAAAGGVGLIAAQWARQLGARVIGVVSTEAKRRMALAHGCEAVLLAASDIVAQVRELTGGEGVPVVYDPVGRDTLFTSLDCLQPRGLLVSFGNASGPVDSLNLLDLLKRGSLYVTRPTLWNYVTHREQLNEGAGELLAHFGVGEHSHRDRSAIPVERGRRRPSHAGSEADNRLDRTVALSCRGA